MAPFASSFLLLFFLPLPPPSLPTSSSSSLFLLFPPPPLSPRQCQFLSCPPIQRCTSSPLSNTFPSFHHRLLSTTAFSSQPLCPLNHPFLSFLPPHPPPLLTTSFSLFTSPPNLLPLQCLRLTYIAHDGDAVSQGGQPRS